MTNPQKQVVYAVLQQGGGSLTTLAYALNIGRGNVKARLLSTCRALGILSAEKNESDYFSDQLVQLIIDHASKLVIESAKNASQTVKSESKKDED